MRAARHGSSVMGSEWLHCLVATDYLLGHPEDQNSEMRPEQTMVLADKNSPRYFPATWEVAAFLRNF